MIHLTKPQVYDSTEMSENMQQCPHCGQMTACNKENMRFDYREDSGLVAHIEGKDTL